MLAELRLSGNLEDEFDRMGNRIADEDILADLIEMPDSTGVTYPQTVVPTASPVWSLAGMVSGYLDVADVVKDPEGHRELSDALCEHQWQLKNNPY